MLSRKLSKTKRLAGKAINAFKKEKTANISTYAADIQPLTTYKNCLSIFETTDIEHFKLIKDVVNFENEDPKKFGFQYPCIILEGDELLMAVRSSFNNADTFHDTNYCLFFREKLPSSL